MATLNDVDINKILQELENALSLPASQIIDTLKGNFLQDLVKFYKIFDQSYNELENFINTNPIDKYGNSVQDIKNGSYTLTLHAAKEEIFYNNVLQGTKKLYQLMHGIRRTFLGEDITYIVYETDSQGTWEHRLTEKELFDSLDFDLTSFGHSKNNLASLQGHLNQRIKELKQEKKSKMIEENLLKQVMEYTGHSHQTISKMNQASLYEIFYSLSNVYKRKTIGPPSSGTKSTTSDRLMHYLYAAHQANLSHLLGGDVLNTQIKTTNQFNLTRISTVKNNLKIFIYNLYNASTREDVRNSIHDIFIGNQGVLKRLIDLGAGKRSERERIELTKLIDKELKHLNITLKI